MWFCFVFLFFVVACLQFLCSFVLLFCFVHIRPVGVCVFPTLDCGVTCTLIAENTGHRRTTNACQLLHVDIYIMIYIQRVSDCVGMRACMRVCVWQRRGMHVRMRESTCACTRMDVGECLLVGCSTSQQHASVPQGRICTDNFTCCHTEIEVAEQTFYLTQS